jgi:hypothetical protein
MLGFGPLHRPFYLYNVNLSGQWLALTDLRKADLNFANLRDATLIFADLRGAELGGANLSGTDLYGGRPERLVVYTRANLNDACEGNKVARGPQPKSVPCSLTVVRCSAATSAPLPLGPCGTGDEPLCSRAPSVFLAGLGGAYAAAPGLTGPPTG